MHPGDYLIADLDGVVCLPLELAEKALDIIEPIVDADRRAAADIAKGRSVTESFKEHRGK